MAPLADVFVRVRVDKRAAEREAREMDRALRRIPNVIDVRFDVDMAGALAKIQLLERRLNALERASKGIRLDTRIDTAGMTALGASIGKVAAGLPAVVSLAGLAVGGLASLGAGFVSLASAIAPAAGALAAFPALALAAGQAAGTAATAFFGIGDAVKAMINMDKQAGAIAEQNASLRLAAAERIREAEGSLAAAQQAAQRVAISGSRAVADAVRQVADVRLRAGEQIEAAEENYIAAQQRSKDAQDDLNRARKEAKEQLEDLALSLKDVALSEEDAQIGLERAQQRLDELRSGARKGTDLDMREADLNVRQAAQRLVEVKERHADLKAEVDDANRKGVDGADNVVQARRRVIDAQEAEADAAKAVRKAQVEASRDIADAQRGVADAQRDAAQANADAAARVAEAQRELKQASEQSAQALSRQSAQAEALAFAMSQISPKAREFAKFLKGDVIPALRGIQFDVQDTFLPKFQTALESLRPLLPIFNKAMVDTANVLGDLAIEGGKMLSSGPFQASFTTLLAGGNRILKTYGDTILKLARVFVIVAEAALPLAEHIADLTLKFATWLEKLATADGAGEKMAGFFRESARVIDQLVVIVGNLGEVFLNIGKAAAPAGRELLTMFEKVTEKWAAFTGSSDGQNTLKKYFDDAIPVVVETSKLFARVAAGIAKLGANPKIAELIKQVQEQLVPAIGNLIDASSGEGAQKIVTFLSDLANFLADLIREGSALNGFIDALSAVLGVFKGFLDLLGPFADEFMYLVGIIGGGLVIIGFLGKIGAAFKRLGGIFGIGGGKKGSGLFSRIADNFKSLDGARLKMWAFRDAATDFGKKLLKLPFKKVGDLIKWMLARVRSAGSDAGFINFGKMFESTGKAVGRFVKAIGGLGSKIGGGLSKIFGGIGKVFSPLLRVFSRLGSFFVKQLPMFFRIAMVAFRGFMAFLLGSNPLGWIVLGITAVVIAFVAFYKRSEWFRGVVQKVMAKVKEAAAAVVQWFKDRWPAIKDMITKVFNGIKAYIKTWLEVWKWIIDKVVGVINWVREKWPAIKRLFTDPIGSAREALQKLWEKIKAKALELVQGILDWVRDKWKGIKAFFAEPLTEARDRVVEIFESIKEKAKGKLQDLIDFAKSVPGKMKDALGKLGQMMKEGVGGGLEVVLDFIDTHLIKNLHKVTSKFGVNLDPDALINFNGFAKGGVVPGPDLGRDSVLAALRGGEGVLVPEAVRAIGGSKAIHAINRAAERGIGGFGDAWGAIKSGAGKAKRGVITAGSTVKRGAVAAKDFGVDVANEIGENLKKGYAYAVERLVDPFIEMFAGAFGGNMLGDFSVGVLKKLRDAVAGKAAAADMPAPAPGGGGFVMPGDIGSGPWVRPASGYRITSEFGPRWGRFHGGIDLAGAAGSPITAASSGIVSRALEMATSYGKHIYIQHANGVHTRYAHMSQLLKSVGDRVNAGDVIGRMGTTGNSTGVHLHFETHLSPGPVNPRGFMSQRGVRLDTGGMLGPEGGANLSGKPERVLSPRQTNLFERMIQTLERNGGRGGNSKSMVVNVQVEPRARKLGWEVGDAVANTAILNGWV